MKEETRCETRGEVGEEDVLEIQLSEIQAEGGLWKVLESAFL